MSRGRVHAGSKVKYANAERREVHRGTVIRKLTERELTEFKERMEQILSGNRKLYHGTI